MRSKARAFTPTFSLIIALVICIGASLVLFSTNAHASGVWEDYKKPVGLTYGAQARIQTTYIWRGIYAGGANIQGDVNVGYGGLYAGMWWNIGVTDWTFNTFEPEVDLSIGFDRWGINVFLLYIHNFNCGFFDFTNYPDKGNRVELDVRYTLSPKIPLSILWASRIAGADSYWNDAGDTVRAYSSYAEISYTQALPMGFSLYGAFGITPWKSCYTSYLRDFAVQNIELRLRKDWSVSERCGLMVQGQLSINPSALAASKIAAEWHPDFPWEQAVNANITFGVYLK